MMMAMAAALAFFSSEDAQAVGQGRQNVFQILPHRLHGAGQVHDQRILADHACAAAQHAPGRDLQGIPAHGLGNAGRIAFRHGQRGLRRLIPPGKTRAAGGQQQIADVFVAQPRQFFFHGLQLVAHQVLVNDLIARAAHHFRDGRAALIRSLAPGALVAQGQNGHTIAHTSSLRT